MLANTWLKTPEIVRRNPRPKETQGPISSSSAAALIYPPPKKEVQLFAVMFRNCFLPEEEKIGDAQKQEPEGSIEQY
jgi:hypothetical protein